MSSKGRAVSPLGRLLRKLWRTATALMMAGMALAPFVPPPPPPPPPIVQIREASGQRRGRSGRRLR